MASESVRPTNVEETLEGDLARGVVGSGVVVTGALELVVSGSSGVSVHSLQRGHAYTLGRGDDCEIAIVDPSVSRRHARLYVGDEVEVEDLESRNGVRVNGERLASGVRRKAPPGTFLHVGNVTVFVQRSAGASSSASARVAPAVGLPSPAGTAEASDRAREAGDDRPVVADGAMRALFAMLDSVAPTPLPVLILGETGVGKEVIAAEVHRRSQRASRPYLQLNCAALPESILEGELFGYERGAFTGAHAAKAGLFESADGGTVFLDELGEMPLSIQAKLLRVLESGDVTRLGALRSKHIDVRFIGATNRQLAQEVRRGAFRADLYYRINGLSITIPPLRKRPADILPLAELFLSRFAAKLGRVCPSLDGSAKDALLKADYPGNVRQLRNVVERAAVVSGGAVIRVEHLDWGDDGADPHPSSSAVAPSALITQAGDMMGDHTVSMPAHAPASARSGAAAGSAHGALSTVDPRSERLTDELKNIERDRIVRALEAAAGNQSEAARILGISRYVLIARIREFGLARPRAGRKNP